MKIPSKIQVVMLTIAAVFTVFKSAALAFPSPPPTNSEVVYARKDCTNFHSPTYCVQSMADVNSWLATKPQNNPVLIDVGPGTWEDFFVCSSQNNVTLRGSGRDTTRLVVTGGFQQTAMLITSCVDLAVESLTAIGSGTGVSWGGTGSSTWTDTDLVGGGAGSPTQQFAIGWYDQSCGFEFPVHYFFGSRIMSLGNAFENYGFFPRCAEHWFFGGEVTATNEVNRATNQTAVFVDGGAEVHFIGTTIRYQVGASTTNLISGPLGSAGGIHGVYVQGAGSAFHSHGAIVNANGFDSELAQSATGIRLVGSNGFVHTHETAFVVNAGTGGTSARVTGDANDIQSPFLWHHATAPPRSVPGDPSSAFVSSIRGADLFVETDCTTSNCNSTGTIPRLMIHRPEWTAANGPWWDVRANACR